MPCEECNVGPGAFEGEAAETAILEYYALNGFADDIVEEDTEGYMREVFIGPVEASQEAKSHASAVGFCGGCIEVGAKDLLDCTSAVFWTDSQGFRFSEVHSNNPSQP
jgi:hypothetical protein